MTTDELSPQAMCDAWFAYRAVHGSGGGAVAVDSQTGEVYTGVDMPAVLAAVGPEVKDRLVFMQLGRPDWLRKKYRLGGRWRRVG